MTARLIFAAALLFLALPDAHAQTASPPVQSDLLAIKIATIGTAHLKADAAAYVKWLGYRQRGSGRVTRDMAISWGAPKSAGRPYVMLGPEDGADVLIRLVEIAPVPGYRALTSSGWNGIELIVNDIDALYARLQGSPFVAKAPPASGVPAYPTIHSMTVEGPAHETLYLTCETGDRATSILETTTVPVGRPFVLWQSGPDILKVRDWYAQAFSMPPRYVSEKPMPGGTGATMPNTVLLLKAPHHLVQFEGNPAQFGARPQVPGQLPPGNAMASFAVKSLDELAITMIAPPRKIYGPVRSAVVLDPNGNRVELIEVR